MGNDLKSLYEYADNAIDTPRVTLQEASASPYASIGVRVGGSAEFMLVLATDSGGTLLWTSSARIALVTKDGRIVRTAGLNNNLSGLQQLSRSPRSDGSEESLWTADFSGIGYGIRLTCNRKPGAEEDVEILGKTFRAQRIDERCVSTSSVLDWQYNNIYWVNPQNGFVWRSIQTIHPHLGGLDVEVLRPPAD